MTPMCVCGEPAWMHFAASGLCYERTCGCIEYMPDNGMEMPSVYIKTEPYNGFYANKQWPKPEAETA
jgi:hypothetical protein